MAQMDFQERVMLGQLGQRDRRGRMGDRVLAQALAPRPVYSTGGALAQGLSGALAGALMNMDDRDDEAAQKRAIERAGEFEQQRQQRYQDQLSLALNGATLPAGEGQQGPTLPAPRGEGRIDALAGLAGNNPLAATMLNVEMRREDAARQERLAREARAHAAALAGRPRLPEGWRMGANGTAERIPGFEEPRRPPTEFELVLLGAGYKPDSPEWRQAMLERAQRMGQPPQTVVNNNQGDSSFDKKRGTDIAETVNAWEAADTRAATTLDRLARLENLNERFQTGALANARLTAGQLAQQLNIPNSALESLGIGRDQVASGEGIRSLTMQLLTAQLGAGGFPTQNFSNADMNALREALPGLMNSPQGNRVISKVFRAAANRDREVGSAWREWRRSNGDTIESARRFQEEKLPDIISRNIVAPLVADAMAIADDQNVRNLRGGFNAAPPPNLPIIRTPAEAAGLPPGTHFRTPDGRTLRVPAQ